MLNILFCVVKQQNVLHWAIFSSGRIVCKLVWYRCCVASTLPCLALMTPKIKWFLLAQIKSSAVLDYAVHTVHCFCFLAKVLLVLCSYYETLSTGKKKVLRQCCHYFGYLFQIWFILKQWKCGEIAHFVFLYFSKPECAKRKPTASLCWDWTCLCALKLQGVRIAMLSFSY